MLFVDRQAELTALRARLEDPSSLSLVYGARRVGKTWLVRHLLEAEPESLYFCADETTAAALLDRFVVAVAGSRMGGPHWAIAPPQRWDAALTLLFESARNAGQRIVLALDEVQYLFEADPSLPSVLQRLVDEYGPRSRCHVILSGSALGTLEALGEVGQPLHGRLDLRLKLRPFAYMHAAQFAPGYGPVEALRLYGVFGGLARHLAQVRPDHSVASNAQRALLDPLAALHEAPLDVLRTERLSSIADASAVLEAISRGEERAGAIASRTGLAKPRLEYVLRELLDLDLLRRDVRSGDKPGSRYVRYRVPDPMMVFWFRFVLPNRTALLHATPTQVWTQRIAPRLDEHMGPVFEQVVAQAVRAGRVPGWGLVDQVGAWWSRDGQTEVDVVARRARAHLLIECKWRPKGRVGVSDLGRLRGHVARLPAPLRSDARLGLATAGTFTDELVAQAQAEAVTLIGPSTLFP